MKINWGTGIVIGMLLFMGFIMFMVITMMTDDAYNHDLVTENYYEKDLMYQQEIDAEQNTKSLSSEIRGERVSEGWMLTFPKELENKNIQGSVFLYRPSNERLDFKLPIILSNSQLLIPDGRLLDGRWNITIDWIYEDTRFMFKKEIFY